MKYEVYKDTRGEWRWRFKAANGFMIAVSSEGYVNKSDCLHSVNLVQSSAVAPVYEIVNA